MYNQKVGPSPEPTLLSLIYKTFLFFLKRIKKRTKEMVLKNLFFLLHLTLIHACTNTFNIVCGRHLLWGNVYFTNNLTHATVFIDKNDDVLFNISEIRLTLYNTTSLPTSRPTGNQDDIKFENLEGLDNFTFSIPMQEYGFACNPLIVPQIIPYAMALHINIGSETCFASSQTNISTSSGSNNAWFDTIEPCMNCVSPVGSFELRFLNSTHLNVHINVSAPYIIYGYHIYVGNYAPIPNTPITTKTGVPIPGKFPFKQTNISTHYLDLILNITHTNVVCGQPHPFYFILHLEVGLLGSGTRETAIGWDVTNNFKFLSSRWGWFQMYVPRCQDCVVQQ
jgi:hypothetical protein